MLDDKTKYWLCCGSTKYPHGEKSCYEAKMGHPEHVRYGTAKEHSEWSKLQRNVKKEHICSINCWCKPYPADEDELVWIHREEEVGHA